MSRAGLNVVPDRSQREEKGDEPGWSKEVKRKRAEAAAEPKPSPRVEVTTASPEALRFMANSNLRKLIQALEHGDDALIEELSIRLSLHNHNKEEKNGG